MKMYNSRADAMPVVTQLVLDWVFKDCMQTIIRPYGHMGKDRRLFNKLRLLVNTRNDFRTLAISDGIKPSYSYTSRNLPKHMPLYGYVIFAMSSHELGFSINLCIKPVGKGRCINCEIFGDIFRHGDILTCIISPKSISLKNNSLEQLILYKKQIVL